MPQLSSYPAISTMGGTDKLLVHQVSSGTEKTITYNDFIRTAAMPFINVLNYGAKGDGATDDTVAITAALAAATAGSVVLFPPTVNGYVITSPITIPKSNVTLLGFGSKITGATQAQFRKFLITSKADIKIEGLNFNGLYSSGTGDLGQGFVEISSSNDVSIVNCRFDNVLKNAIYIAAASSRISIQNNYFSNFFCAVFSDDNTTIGPSYVRIVNNSFKSGFGTTSTAYSGAVKFSGIVAGTYNTPGNHVISGNIIENPGQMGIEIHTFVNQSVISDNTIYGAGFGISVVNSHRCSVTGNTTKACDQHGIEFAAGSGRGTCSGNAVDGYNNAGAFAGGRGISINDNTTTGIAITGNTLVRANMHVFGNTCSIVGNQLQYCLLYLQSAYQITVVGNTFVGVAPADVSAIVIDVSGSSGTHSGFVISGNTFKGTFDYRIIRFQSLSGTAQIAGVLITGNNTSEATGAGAYGLDWVFDGSTTKIVRAKSYGNLWNTSIPSSNINWSGTAVIKRTTGYTTTTGVERAVDWSAAEFDDIPETVWMSQTPHVIYFPRWANSVRVTASIRWASGAGDNLGFRKVKIKTYGNIGGVWASDFRTCVGAGTGDSTTVTFVLTRAYIELMEGNFPAWAASTVYPAAAGSNVTVGVVSYNGENWLCHTAHTSGATFDYSKWRASPAVYVTTEQTSGGNVDVSTGSRFSIEVID